MSDGERNRVRSLAILIEFAAGKDKDVSTEVVETKESPRCSRVEQFRPRVISDDGSEIPVAGRVRISAGAAAEEPNLKRLIVLSEPSEQRTNR